MKTKQELIEKAKKEWGETWDEGMIEYDAEYNEYIVWVGKEDIYKAFFDADTLELAVERFAGLLHFLLGNEDRMRIELFHELEQQGIGNRVHIE